MRRLVLLAAAAGTLIEAMAFGGTLFLLGRVIDAYSMSLGGIPPERGRTGVWLLATVLAGGLAGLTAMLVAAAVRGRYGRPTRAALIGGAVLHWILAVVVGITIGWPAFIAVLAVFLCLVSALVLWPAPGPAVVASIADDAPAEAGQPGAGSAAVPRAASPGDR